METESLLVITFSFLNYILDDVNVNASANTH
jgi:hypothetical protein